MQNTRGSPSYYKTIIKAPDNTLTIIKAIGSQDIREQALRLLPDERSSLLLLLALVDPEPDRVLLVDVDLAVDVSHSDVTKPSSIVEVDEQEPTTRAPTVGVTGR